MNSCCEACKVVIWLNVVIILMQLAKWFIILGGFNAMLTVILGAFAAHGLKSRLGPEMLGVFNTGVQYHFYHALGLLVTGLLVSSLPPNDWIKWSGWLMLTGIVLFPGSLYLLALGLPRWLGAVTPFGGFLFILAWACLVMAIINTWNMT